MAEIIPSTLIKKIENSLINIQSGTFFLFGPSKILKLNLVKNITLKNIEFIYLVDDDIIPIEKIRYVLNYVRLKSNNLRVVVIDVDNVNIYSLNAMLKTLEEPPDKCIFFLLKNDTNVIPTILSRAIKVFVNIDLSNLIEYLVKFYNYSLNWAEFVVFCTNSNWDLIDYFNNNYWLTKEKKANPIFYKILNFLQYPTLEVVFDEEFWIKNFPSFLSFRFLITFIKAFLKDLYYLKVIESIYDIDLIRYLEKNLVFTKVLNKEEFFNNAAKFKIDTYRITRFFDSLKISSNSLYKRINKKILYLGILYKFYCLLMDKDG